MEDIQRALSKLLITKRGIRHGGHIGGSHKMRGHLYRQARAKERRMTRYSRRMNRHRAGRRRSTKAPRRTGGM